MVRIRWLIRRMRAAAFWRGRLRFSARTLLPTHPRPPADPVRWARRLAGALAVAWALVASAAIAEEQTSLQIDSPMMLDPKLPQASLLDVFSPALKPLWERALARPERDVRRTAADLIALAHLRGMKGLETTVPALVAALEAPDQHDVVRRAVANALVSVDARQAADVLARQLPGGNLQLAQVIEPALARWDYRPQRAEWLARLADPEATSARLLLAIEGLGQVRETQAGDAMLRLVQDEHQPPNVRLAAARSLAKIRPSGLAPAARALGERAAAESLVARLLAAALLSQHTDAAAIGLLKEYAVDKEPAVCSLALERLLAIDPGLAFDLAPGATKNADARVRRLGAAALAEQGDVAAIRTMQPLLDDVNPGVRRFVAAFYFRAGQQDALRATVIECTTEMLARDSWRCLEQAALVVGHLDHKPAAPRLIEILRHARPEVDITAAWALGRLQVPESFPAMLEQATQQYQRFVDRQVNAETSGPAILQIAQLFQGLGIARYRAVEPLARKYVPKNHDLGQESRAAACWALGLLYENNPDAELSQLFVERLRDSRGMNPENPYVRCMCAVGLGRMKSQSGLEALRTEGAIAGRNTIVGQACGWAIEQLTGEKSPPPVEVQMEMRGWFIEPLE